MLTRRSLGKSLALLPLVRCLEGKAFAEEAGDGDCGVTSGMPEPDGFVIWTRVPSAFRVGLGQSGEIEVTYEVSTSETFAPERRVAGGRVRTSGARDFTVKVPISGLEPDRRYFYRFATATGYTSVTGRARTAPSAGARRDLKLAMVSCQSFSAGYYSSYLSLVREEVDFVVHLGDHIYERDTGRAGSPDPLGGRECRSLDDYRSKYRYYLSDPAWREARRCFTWIDLWDDHEVFNDWSRDDVGGDAARFTGAFQAFAEYMPIRGELVVDGRGRPSLDAYRVIQLGGMADLFLLDERQYRDGMPCDEDFMTVPCAAAKAADRTMLGRDQLEWLKSALGESTARWRVLLSEVMVAPFKVPAPTPRAERGFVHMFNGKAEIASSHVLNLDAWDGYPAERAELLEFVADRRIENLVTITGDIHSAYNAVLHREPTNSRSPAVGVEVVTSAISSWPLAGSLRRHLGADGEAIVARHNPHFAWLETAANGYALLSFSEAGLAVSHVAVETTARADGRSRVIRQTRVPSGRSVFL